MNSWKTTRASATAGSPAKPAISERSPSRLRGLSLLLNLLAVLFLVLPVLLFISFQQLDADRRALALNSVRDSGLLIGAALRPALADMSPSQFGALQADLAPFADLHRRITLLYKPAQVPGGQAGFFYVAGVPAVPPDALAAERQRLVDMGVLDRLSQACTGNQALAERVALPEQKAELLTSVSPINGPAGCWAVVVATDAAGEMSLTDQQAYWARPEMQAALLLYGLMALICLGIFWRTRIGLAAFRTVAQQASSGAASTGAGGFEAASPLREFVPLAREFDQMVARLNAAAATLRQAAEENAHALKGKLATIRQLAAHLPDAESQNAMALALDRLDGLVQSARRLDTATAEALDAKRHEFDLSGLVNGFARGYRQMLGDAGTRLQCDATPGLRLLGDEEMVEVILENLVENALSFTPEPGSVTITLARESAFIVLRVADQGPGVDPALLPHIFGRYMSSRPQETSAHYGIGLWLVRQNAQALGGQVTAHNRDGGGLEVVVRFG